MSAPHTITYDVYQGDERIDCFELDADLDYPLEIFNELSKELKRSWFNARVLFRLSEHIYYAEKGDFKFEDLTLKISDVKDWG